jgi:hypothetical protein
MTLAVVPQGCMVKDSSVQMNGVASVLIDFLSALGRVSPILFRLPVIITSARDGNHVASTKHTKGWAVDLRITDKPELMRVPFIVVCIALSLQYGLVVMDESNLPGAPHVHIEVAG